MLTLINESLDRHRHRAGDRIVGREGLGLELTLVPLERAIERFFRISLAGLGKNDSSVVDVNLDPVVLVASEREPHRRAFSAQTEKELFETRAGVVTPGSPKAPLLSYPRKIRLRIFGIIVGEPYRNLVVAYADAIAVAEFPPLEAFLVDVGAVRASEVMEHERVAFVVNLGVVVRHVSGVERQIV